MTAALRNLFSSKKFITMLVGLAVALGARFGLQLEPELVASIVGLFAVLIGAQGLADQGKEAAKESKPSSTPLVMLVVIAFGLTAITTSSGCSGLGGRASSGAKAFIDCMAPDTKAVAGELVPAFGSMLRASLDGTGKLDRQQLGAIAAPLKSSATRCALDAAIAVLLSPPAPRAGAPASSPLEVDTADVAAAYADVRSQLWGGVELRSAAP